LHSIDGLLDIRLKLRGVEVSVKGAENSEAANDCDENLKGSHTCSL
jgi:hypothetical protein